MPMRQSLMEQLQNYKKGGLVDIGMLQQAMHVDSSQLIKNLQCLNLTSKYHGQLQLCHQQADQRSVTQLQQEC